MNLCKYFNESNYICRIATDADISRSTNLINHAFSYQNEAKGDVRISPENLRERMAKSEFYVFMDYKDDLVGCVYIEILDKALHFGLLALADHLRGTGLSGKIINSIEEYAKHLKKNELELDYMSLSPWLKSYYERYGFKTTGQVEDIGWCTLVRMTKQI